MYVFSIFSCSWKHFPSMISPSMCFVCFSHRVSLLLYYHLENCSLTHKLFSMISSETKSIVSMWSLISVNILSNLICLLKKYDQVLWLFRFLFSVLCTLSLVSRHLNKKGIKRSLMCMYKKIRLAASFIRFRPTSQWGDDSLISWTPHASPPSPWPGFKCFWLQQELRGC